jgi:very-short-patch-repair endonuclease
MDKKIKIICPKHGEFYQTPRNHKNNHGCPICNTSKGEKKIREFLINKNIYFTQQYRFIDCKNILPLPFDFYLPKKNICIEYDGKQHFDKKSKYYSENLLKNDNIKNIYCKNNKIKLIRISYKKFKNIYNVLSEVLTWQDQYEN